jgi:AmmeMemoRadiSam system protein B
MDNPRIRHIEAHPFQQEGKEMILLRDAEGVVENSLVVSKDVVFLISLMDGTRSLRDIQAEYMRRLGQLVYIEHLEQFVEAMDKHLLLLNDNFKDHVKGLREEYEKSPVRKAYLAGKSYHANKMDLLQFLDEMFKVSGERTPKGNVAGILAPHIDYERGSQVYRETYPYLKNGGDKPLLVILGTCHHATDRIWSISLKDFSTPLDVVPNSGELGGLIKNNAVLKHYIDEWPHRNEHSIELQLPLIQFMLQDGFEILPILTGSMHEYVNGDKDIENDSELGDIVESFKAVLEQWGKPYMVISGADLAHIGMQFGDRYALDSLRLGQSRAEDEQILRCIGDVDADGFFRMIQDERDERRICGLTPIYFQLKLLEGSTCEIVSYKQWTDGKSSVSFAGGLFYRK